MAHISGVKFVTEAIYEFHESVDWYESKTNGLGLRFIDEIDSTIERIKLNPEFYPTVVEDIRKIQINKFPFSVFYKIEEDLLVILRLFHNKRKPIEW
jgi:plasmid stabilization system protein ParE